MFPDPLQMHMSDIDGPLAAIQDAISSRSLPPVQAWQPSVTRDIAMRIDREGAWFYQGSAITRQRMVKLFATVLRRDDDGETYLVTPQERLRIQVDDAPFTAVAVERHDELGEQALVFRTNVDEQVLADAEHPIVVEYAHADADPRPYLIVRDRLRALISRAVFLELTDYLETRDGIPGVVSRGTFMPMGPPDDNSPSA